MNIYKTIKSSSFFLSSLHSLTRLPSSYLPTSHQQLLELQQLYLWSKWGNWRQKNPVARKATGQLSVITCSGDGPCSQLPGQNIFSVLFSCPKTAKRRRGTFQLRTVKTLPYARRRKQAACSRGCGLSPCVCALVDLTLAAASVRPAFIPSKKNG